MGDDYLTDLAAKATQKEWDYYPSKKEAAERREQFYKEPSLLTDLDR